MAAHEAREGTLELVVVDDPPQRGHLHHCLAQELGVALRHCEHEVAEGGLLQRIEAGGGAEVDQGDAPSTVEHHHVARVRVGVEVTVDQHLVDHAAQQRARPDPHGPHRGRRRAIAIAHAHTVDPLHDQHALNVVRSL